LQRLRTQAGEPSVREIARLSGQLSHDTVHRTLTGPAIPRWPNVEAVVRALGADPEKVKPLWLAARLAGVRRSNAADEYVVEQSAKPVSLTVPDVDLPGYLLKGAPQEDIVHAIRQVAAGIPVFTAESAALMLAHYREETDDGPPPLSTRETDVLRLVGAGLNNREIGQSLAVSVRTVDAYRTRIRDKLGLRNRASLVRYAIEHGLAGE
jgi:DNA-binding CsgD family transcriptional regulator